MDLTLRGRVGGYSLLDNNDYRAANGRAQEASLTVVCRPPAGPKAALGGGFAHARLTERARSL